MDGDLPPWNGPPANLAPSAQVALDAYLKAGNSGTTDQFGYFVAVDGDIAVVGAPFEASNASTVNGDGSNNSAFWAGAAYIFTRSAGVWTQQAYLKPDNSGTYDVFGLSVAVDGDTVVIGAPQEGSNANTVNGDGSNNSASQSGAVYVFTRSGGDWTQEAYLKAANSGASDGFGRSVAIDGDTIVIGAAHEDSNATTVNGNGSDNSAYDSGAAYVFTRSGGDWTQEAYLKAANSGESDFFGRSVAIDGDTVVIGANGEDSNANTVNGDGSNNSASVSGAAYVFTRSGGDWTQEAYLKAGNSGPGDNFGWSVAVDGNTAVIGAYGESGNATSVNGDGSNNSADNSGAAYVFTRSAGVWNQQAYLKAGNSETWDYFGYSVDVDGETVVVGAYFERSNANTVNGDGSDNSASGSGAAYVFTRSQGVWFQTAYLKAGNSGAGDLFGYSVAVDGGTALIGAPKEGSNATTVNGDGSDNSATNSGAAYTYDISYAGIHVTPTVLASLSTTIGNAPTSSPFTVSGMELEGDITLTAPAGFEISADASQFTSSLTLTATAGAVPATTLYARLVPGTPFGTVSGELTLTSPGSDPKTLSLSGTVRGLISLSATSLSGFSAPQTFTSTSQSITVQVSTVSPDAVDGPVSGLSPAITVAAPAVFELSTDASTYSSSVVLADFPATLHTRLAANAPAGAVSGNLTLTSTGFVTATLPVSGEVIAPSISATPAQITLAGLRGTASPSRTINVTGVSLNADILATASAGFEISADNVTFGATATLPAVAGSVDGTLHVRLTGSSTAALGQSTGSLTLSSNLASTVTVGLQGFIEADLPAYGTVQTFAGTGTSGSTDGNATTARFNGPWGISVDAQGNLYPIDYSGKRIRKVTTGAVASFLDAFTSFPPQYSAVDPATGHLYVSIETHRILRYVNKNAANYPAQAPVYGPETDFSDSVIVYAGASTSGSTNNTGTSARFNVPRGIAVHDGHLYVADRNNNAIRKINLSNAAVTTVTLTQGTVTAPEGIAVDPDGVLFVTSTGTDSIVRISTAGVVSTVAGGGGSGYQDGSGSGVRFNDPHGIALDALGNLIVADSGNHAIRRVTPEGEVVTVAGGSPTGSHSDGLGTAARFNSPRGLVFGPDGWLYVTDFNNHRIRRVNAAQPRMVLTPASLSPFTADFGSASDSQTVEVDGSASAGLITITAPDGFEVSTDGTTYASSVEVNSTAALLVRIAATPPLGAVTGDLTFVSENAGTQTLALSGEVILPRTPVVFRAPGVVYTGNTSVRLEGTVNPNGYDTTVQFEYGTTTSYGTFVPVTLSDANGTSAEAVSLSLSDLATGIYHYRITATNSKGTISSSDGVFSIYIPSDGTPDTAYNSLHGTKLTGSPGPVSIRDSAMDASGRWFGIGSFLAYSGTSANGLLCLKPDGTPDAEFHTNLGSGLSHSSSSYPTKILIRQNGKILISGQFDSLNGTPIRKGIASLNADGTLDADFTAKLNALRYQFGFFGISEQADGKILGSYSGKLLRLNLDGTPDDSFESPTFAGMIGAIAVQPDGKILVASNFSGLKRLHPDGSADTEFNSTLGTNFNRDSGNMSVEVIRVAPDGGIWVGGYFSEFNGQSVPGLVRLNPDGTLDSSALTAYGLAFTGSTPTKIGDIHLQRDGKVVVCGTTASFYNSWTSNGLRRLNADGSLDLQFSSNLGFGLSGIPMTMAVRPTGELIVAGSITHINHQVAKGIIQLGWGSSMTPETQSLAATYGSAIGETQALTPSGTSGTASYSISPALPYGLNLDASTGVISGTPLTVVDTTTHTITATGSEGGTATSTLTLSVAKAPLTITANDAVRPYGQSNPAFTVGVTGFVNGDTLSAISGAAQISCAATAGSSPGQYAITPSLGKLAAPNYSFQNFVPGTLTVGKAAQTLSIAPLASSVPLKELSNVSLSASSSAGLPVTLSLEAGSAATLAGSVGAYSLSDIGQTGTVTVRARQAGNATYEAAQDVLVSFDVTKSNQAITFDAPSDKTFGDDPFTLAATADSGLPVTFTLISGPAQLEGSSITLTGAGEVVIRASQAGNELYNEATAQTRSFSVGRAAQSLSFGTLGEVIYGDAPVALAATSDSGLDVTYDIVSGPATLVAGTVAHHAAGTVVVRASQEGDDNHLPAEPVERTLIVNPKTLMVTGAIALDKVADETTTAQILGAQLEGVIDGDEVFLFNDQVGSFPQATPGSDLVVTTSMTLDGGDAGNYTLVQPSLTASITEPENTDAPSAPSSLVATAGDGQVSIAFAAGAEGGSAITNHEFSLDDGNSWIAFNPAVTSSPVVITGLTNGSPYSIRLRAVNANGSGTASEAVSATPVAPISPPSFAGYAASTKEGKTLALSGAKVLARATDPDGGAVTLTQVFGPSTQGGTVSLTGTLNYTPAASFTGSDSFDIELTGSRGGTLRATVTVTVTANTAATSNQTQLQLRDGKVDLTFRGIPGRTYTIQRSTNLLTWTTLATVTAAADGRITYTDPSPPQPSGYYRAQ